MEKSVYLKKILVFAFVVVSIAIMGGQPLLADYGYGGSGGRITFRCADQSALNYTEFGIHNPALCLYPDGVQPPPQPPPLPVVPNPPVVPPPDVPNNPPDPFNPNDPGTDPNSPVTDPNPDPGPITKSISTIKNVTEDAILTVWGNVIAKIVAIIGLGSALMAVFKPGVLFASPLFLREIFLVPFRLGALLLSALGLKRKYRPWGTVYDSVTKQPLDPAYVTLKNEQGREVATSITDLDGRYGFFVQKGIYYITASKTHYVFPSQKMQGKNRDDLYTDLYFGERIDVAEDSAVIYKNIPMDREGFDWNEFEKSKSGVMRFHHKNELRMERISNLLFPFGFVFAVVALLVTPEPYNYLIFGLYIVMVILRSFGFKPKVRGSIIDSSTGESLSFAIISVFSVALDRELFKKVADQYGHYYILVPKGEYILKISRKNPDE